MAVSDIFYLYLMPWTIMLGVMLVIGFLFRLAEKVSGAKLHRQKSWVAGVACAAMAFLFFRIAFTHGYGELPRYLRYSLIGYGLCGAILAWGALVDLGALLSEQMDDAKRALVAADNADE
jgi:hypothetical protein